MYFIHLIADYGIGDPAFGEVIHRLKSLESKIEIFPTSVPAFSTITTGFWIAQYGLYNPNFKGLAIYSNTAPRKDQLASRKDNGGEQFMYAKLDNGVPIMAVNSGYSFSFVKNHIKKMHLVNATDKGSQFRSRDFFPQAVVGILKGEEKYIGRLIDTSIIPNPPSNKIALIDGYGNIKTTIRRSSIILKAGDKVRISINNKEIIAIFTEGIFEVREGRFVFAPGSSGGDDPFMEISLRGSNAALAFNKPKVEAKINWKKK